MKLDNNGHVTHLSRRLEMWLRYEKSKQVLVQTTIKKDMPLHTVGGTAEKTQILLIYSIKQLLWNNGVGLVGMQKANCLNCTIQKMHGNTKLMV